MKQKCSNNFKLNGSVLFNVYDQNNNLVNSFQNHNIITQLGVESYKKILTSMMLSNYPYNETSDDSQQKSLLSNYVQLGGQSGQVEFLQPIIVTNKYNTTFDKAIKQDSTVDNSTISNQLSFWKNSDNRTTFIQNTTNGWSNYNDDQYNNITNDHWAYVYNVGDSNTNYNEYHTGIKLDIKGSSNKKNYFRIAYQFDDGSITQFSDIKHTVYPLNNGKPLFKEYPNYYGMQLMNDQIYSYFFDMYPRYCKIPKKIIFIFQSNGQSNDVSIQNIQFITHKQQNIGPICLYVDGYYKHSSYSSCSDSSFESLSSQSSSSSLSSDPSDPSDQYDYGNTLNGVWVTYDSSFSYQYHTSGIFKTQITQCKCVDNNIYYYAKIGYEDANGLYIEHAGLCNSQNNIRFDQDSAVNFAFGQNQFYRPRFANASQCNQLLTRTNYNYIKTNKNRIDILYKINVQFGE